MQVLFEIMVQNKQKGCTWVESPPPRSFSGGNQEDALSVILFLNPTNTLPPMSSLVSCSLTLRLHLSHCAFDSRPLFLGEALLPPLVSPSSCSPLSLSIYIHTYTYIDRYYFLFFSVTLLKQRPVSHVIDFLVMTKPAPA